MNSYKIEQRRLAHRGREFHFVSYDITPGNAAKQIEAVPAKWFLMNGGKRWPVMDQMVGQPLAELDAALLQWLDANLFS